MVEYTENHLKTANPDAYTARELADLQQVLSYAEQTDKTARQFYVTGVNCVGEYAYKQMSATKQRFGKTGGNLAYHAYQSFAPNEVTPEQAHAIGVALAKNIWGDRYEVVVTTHLNTRCLHNHMVVNSVSFVDGKKLDNNYAMYFKNLRAQSDKLCVERGLSVIENPAKSSGSRWMRQAERRGEPTLYSVVRSDIDNAVRQSMTDTQFYRLLRQWGYIVNDDPKRKYATIRPAGMKHNIRFKTLGEDYTPQAIAGRILENQRPEFSPPIHMQTKHYHLRGNLKTSRKYKGLYARYLYYCYLLGVFSRKHESRPKPLSPEIRAAVRLIRKYSEQTRLLYRERIETVEQLTAFIDTHKQNLSDFERQRVRIYNRMKSAKTPEAMDMFKAERDELSGKIKVIRKKLYYAHDVLSRHGDIERQIRVERELRAKRFKQPHQKNRERDIPR
ncbi:MAG: relaxase/mobilization nuclease domain-containing protein [Oscillospiraceae bacterium]|nr:relaxase/mobilization nuclease domain-containing protein [Oscillospiraceae bacterium]